MINNELKFAYYKFSNWWKSIILTCILGILVISTLIEIPEKVFFGHELGYFMFPVMSSILISLLIFFFTSHYQDCKKIFEQYLIFESHIELVRDFLLDTHLDTEPQTKPPTFKEIDLGKNYKVLLTNEFILNTSVNIGESEMKFIDKMRIGFAKFLLRKDSNSPAKGILDSEYQDFFHFLNFSCEVFQKDGDMDSFFRNINLTLSNVNYKFCEDRDYQLIYFLRNGHFFLKIELERNIVIQK